MPINARLSADEFAALGDSIKPADVFKEDGDGYVADVAPINGWELRDTAALRTALQRERGNVKERDELLSAFDGLNPEDARKALTDVEELRKQLKKGAKPDEQLQAQFDAKIASINTKHAETTKARDEREAHLTRQITKRLVDSELTAILARPDVKGNPRFLLPLGREATKVVEDKEGNFKAVVIDPKTGHERMSSKSDDPNVLMSLEELVMDEWMKQDEMSGAFGGTSSSGSDSTTSTPGGPQGGRYTLTEKDALDPLKYRAAKAAAEKAGKELVIVP